jgi:hypothetical protein
VAGGVGGAFCFLAAIEGLPAIATLIIAIRPKKKRMGTPEKTVIRCGGLEQLSQSANAQCVRLF